MATAWEDRVKGGWIASFRGANRPGAPRRRLRLPRTRVWDKTSAVAYAAECERYARVLEGVPTAAEISHAEELGVLTRAQAQAMRTAHCFPSVVAGERDPFAPWTLVDAAEAHPATRREKATRPGDYRKHIAGLEAFAAWSGSQRLDALTLDQVVRWVDHLRGTGVAWDTRRHRLLYLRRAARMAAAVAGMPDVLGGIALDRNDQRADPQVWPLAELIEAAVRLERGRLVMHHRAPVVIALGAGMGLRPSELLRLRVGHVAGDVLRVGAETRKNAASRRDLPIPASLLPWITAATRDPKTGDTRPPTDWLIPGRCKRALSPHALDAWWQQYVIPELAGELTPKHLRKTFATWSSEAGIEPRHVEAYLGHRASELAAVTSRHYIAAGRVAALRPAATALDVHLATAIAAARAQIAAPRPKPERLHATATLKRKALA